MICRLRYFLIFPLVVLLFGKTFSQSDTSKTKLSFDLGITRGGNVNVWPLYKRYKSAEKKELMVLYPFYSKKRNYVLHKTHTQVAPFYISDSSSKGIDKRFISFYYPSVIHTHKQFDSTGKSSSFKFIELAPHISLLDVSRSSNGMFVENNFFFFIWYKKNVEESKTHLVVFPAYWYFANKKDTTKAL
ncbi:MAG: hypothetical protein IAF38_16520, partial [Bacteroidia bacterium]|nr:hypothetical protein [Bacteroidia bacterium]